MNIKDFLSKNKVFLLGLLAAIGVVLQQYLSDPVVDYKVILYAAAMAALSYIANQWRGQGVTVFGVIGTLAYTFVSINQTGHFTWQQFIISSIAAMLAAVASPPKPSTYEKNAVIVQAKEVPPTEQVKDTTTPPLGMVHEDSKINHPKS